LGGRLIRGARYVIATSEQEKQELLEGGIEERRLVVRRNGIDAPETLAEYGRFRSQWVIPGDSKLVLFLGRLTAKKSPEMLIEAFARWQAAAGRGTPAVLVLAGPVEESSYLRDLKDLCGKLSLKDTVRFTGPLYGDAKWSAYRDADVFVLPSQHENFGNTAAESAACGTPVIVTDRCGIAPIISGRAGVVIEHSVNALESALSTLLAKSNLRESIRDGCASVTRELSWDEPIAQMEDIYKRCMESATLR